MKKGIIDEKGRMFGKINIIDLLIIILLVIAVIFAIIKILPEPVPPEERPKAYTFILNCRETPFYTAEKIKVGADVYDNDVGKVIGTLESVEFFPYYEAGLDPNDPDHLVESNYYTGAILKVKCKAVETQYGLKINDVLYGSGHSFVLYFNDAKLYVKAQDYTRR